jgi:hypothetical protein
VHPLLLFVGRKTGEEKRGRSPVAAAEVEGERRTRCRRSWGSVAGRQWWWNTKLLLCSELSRAAGARLPWLVSWGSLVGGEHIEEEGKSNGSRRWWSRGGFMVLI